MSYLINSMDTSYYERQFEAMDYPAQYPYIASGDDSSDGDTFSDLDDFEHQYRDTQYDLTIQLKQLKQDQRALRKEQDELKRDRIAFENESAAQRVKWESITKSLNAKVKSKKLDDDDTDFSKKGKEEASDDGSRKGGKSKGGKWFAADHEKCHKVHDRTKKRLKEKIRECEELQRQIGKLREELRESHQSDEKFLEMGQTVITQKFELQSLKEENKKLQDLYNNLAAHCRTTAYIDCEETHDLERTCCTHSHTPETSQCSSSSSSSGIEILSAERPTPCGHSHCRPTPQIIRFVRTTRGQPEPSPSCPDPSHAITCGSRGVNHIDSKFREVHELSQQIEELREQLLDVKRSASFTRSGRSCSYESSRSGSERAKSCSMRSRRCSSAPAMSSVIDQLIEECPEEEMDDLEATPPYKGRITWDEDMEGRSEGKTKGQRRRKEKHHGRAKRKGPCNGLWRLFGGICGSRANRHDD